MSKTGEFIRLWKYRLDILWERIRGLDMTKSVGYDASERNAVLNVMSNLEIRAGDRLLDIGVGKGITLYWLKDFPFQKIDGLEISPKLAEIARKNIDKLKLKKSEVFTQDASAFNGYDDYNYYYLYNPFGSDILKKVLAKIQQSIEQNPRTIRLIYCLPNAIEAFDEYPIFQLEKEFKIRHRILVFTNKVEK